MVPTEKLEKQPSDVSQAAQPTPDNLPLDSVHSRRLEDIPPICDDAEFHPTPSGLSLTNVESNHDLAKVTPKRRRLKRILSDPLLQKLNPSMVLVNSGSVARDHLALERTFLAYIRTSLTTCSMGVVLVQLFTLSSASANSIIHRVSKPLGAAVIAFGFSVLMIGVVRYFRTQDALTKGNFPVARSTVLFMTTVVFSLIAVVFGVLVVAVH